MSMRDTCIKRVLYYLGYKTTLEGNTLLKTDPYHVKGGKPEKFKPGDCFMNPNREKEEINCVFYDNVSNAYYISFNAGTESKVAEWKKTLQETGDIHIVESGKLTIAFSDKIALKEALALMVKNNFIERNFFSAAHAAHQATMYQSK